MALFLIPGVSASLYLWKRDPQLIERRLQSKEKISEQRLLMRMLIPVFVAAFLLVTLLHSVAGLARVEQLVADFKAIRAT